jgi:hypothetical protein
MSPLAQLTAAGVELEARPDGKLRATGYLTDALRALIRAHKPELLAELAANDEVDEGVLRRRGRAMAILAEDPNRQIAVVAEAGDPALVAVAIKGVAVGELAIPCDRYDAFELLVLMRQHAPERQSDSRERKENDDEH